MVFSRIRRIIESTAFPAAAFFLSLFFYSVQAFGTSVPAGQSVAFAWAASPDPNVTGYNIYYGVASGDYTAKVNAGNATSTTISGLVAGVTYYFAATAYDSLGDESVFSGEVSYLVPAGAATLQFRNTTAGQFTLTVSGQTNHTYQIQATQDFKTWTIIGSATMGAGGSLDFTDTNAPNFPARFYRTSDTTP